MSRSDCGEQKRIRIKWRKVARMGELPKLLGFWPSPYSMRVRIALELKGINYEYIEEDLKNKSQLLLQSNPVHKKIPVLIHNGKSISESLIILEYIEETWAGGVNLLPKHPYDRALSRFWASFVDDKVVPAFRRTYSVTGVDQQKAKEETVANFLILEEALRTDFKGKPFFGGEEIGYMDIVLGVRTVWFKVVEEMTGVKPIDPHKTPLLHDWIRRFSAHPSVNKLLPDFDELFSYGLYLQRQGQR